MKRLVFLTVILLLTLAAQSAPRTWHVSRTGDNSDGLTWATAWNELNRIDWSRVQTGDTILLDGGSVACPPLGDEVPGCGMVYNTPLTIGRDGVTVALGTPGTAILDGNQTVFTYCGENAPMSRPPTSPAGGVLGTVVSFNGRSGVTLDGTKWGGLVVRNGQTYGVNLGGGDGNTVRFVKVHHINNPADTTNNSVGVTMGYTADVVTIELSEIYRNGQDAIRGTADDLTVQNSYLHDHYCNHPDAVQAFVPTSNTGVGTSEQVITNMRILGNVFERVGLQQVFLGENVTHQSWVDGLALRGNLFGAGAYVLKTKHGRSTNFVLEYNTFAGSSQFGIEWCCASPGAASPMRVENNIFANIKPGGTGFYFSTGGGATVFANNCVWNSGGITGQYTQTGTIRSDPRFQPGTWLPAAGGPCAGKGASLGRALDLLALGGTDAPAPTATDTATPVPTWTDEPTATPTATETPTVTPMVTDTPADATGSPTAGATATDEPTATPTPTDAPTGTVESPTATPECWRLPGGLLCFYPDEP